MGSVDNEGKGTIKTDQTFQLSDVKHLGWKIEEKPVLRFTFSTILKKDFVLCFYDTFSLFFKDLLMTANSFNAWRNIFLLE